MYDQIPVPFVVRARGEIDLDTAPRLHDDLVRALAAHREVVVDLSGLTFMDCSGLGALVQARHQADRQGARLVLRGVGRSVARLFELAGLDHHLFPGPPPTGTVARPRARTVQRRREDPS
ncbi:MULTISPECIES: STAS domain-containing protein [Kitasatospora]|uniref:Anti-sigma factor antagonist n=1 Tax=Kitasatospora cathayae TaxID=3004092 RepID=A0ABY7PXR4_9ACTN|nr:STAS domain-containing protein [Kitasatospora sp. HUAS 3-15]WBP84771.1 STAS domain-containing protein [Kitasatospora sp. HUAS 3-15]